MNSNITRRTALSSMIAGTASLSMQIPALAQTVSDPSKFLDGKIFLPGDKQYEPLRQASTWNARKPDRFPSAIVLPRNQDDVVAAVRLAIAKGWQVSTRSGGHSFTGAHTRDNALLINLALMKELSIDPELRVASISPSWRGGEFAKALRAQHDLTFPVAHGYDVGMGGFVLCGGHGWNNKVLGLGCENLIALDVVTANGELIRADESQNSDFLWAARGSGPGFFGVAVRYHLEVHPRPTHITLSRMLFPLSMLDEVAKWIEHTDFPAFAEETLAYLTVEGQPMLAVVISSFANSEDEAMQVAAIVNSCPIAHRAIEKSFNVPAVIPSESEAEDVYQVPTGARFTVDGVYSNEPIGEVLGRIVEELENPPVHDATIAIAPWGPSGKVRDMAYSINGNYYYSAMTMGYDPADDARCADWLGRIVAKLAPIATGSQMNDENMPVNTLPYLSREASARLEAMRQVHDPHGRFTSFLR